MVPQAVGTQLAVGFLTVAEYPGQGLFGGYLVVDTLGRPLEFHCTAPVRPTRAQEILYGPTLRPFLFGCQIGGALVGKARRAASVVLTDQEPALAVRERVECPVALVLVDPPFDGAPVASQGDTLGSSGQQSHRSPPGPLHRFALGANWLAVPRSASADQQAIRDRLGPMAEEVDLAEPFQRIREAIEEARRGGG